MGTIFRPIRRRKNGTQYECPILSISYYDPVKGFSRTESSGSTDPRVAERLLRDREQSKDEGKTIIVGANKITMHELFHLVITEKRNNGRRAVETEHRRIEKHLLPFLGNQKAIHVTFEAIESYKQARINAKATNGTINRELALIRQAFRLGAEHGKVAQIPKIKLLEEDNVRKGFFEEGVFLLLLDNLPEELKPLHIFDYFTGIRCAEELSILWDHVDRLRWIVRLEATKNGEPREIHYAENEELRRVIEQQWKMKCDIERTFHRQVEYLFFRYPGTGRGTKPGNPIKSFRGAFNKALEKAGITYYEYIKGGQKVLQKRIPHDFRRTAIRNLRRAGVDRSTIKIISGHETDSVFERYNIRDPQETRAALGKVAFQLQQQKATVVSQRKETNSKIHSSKREQNRRKSFAAIQPRRRKALRIDRLKASRKKRRLSRRDQDSC